MSGRRTRFPDLGDALKTIRTNAGIPANRLADACNVDITRIYKFEGGKMAPPYSVIDVYLTYGGNRTVLYTLKLREDPTKYTLHGMALLRIIEEYDGDPSNRQLSEVSGLALGTTIATMRRLYSDDYVNFYTEGQGRKAKWRLNDNAGKPFPGEGEDRGS